MVARMTLGLLLMLGALDAPIADGGSDDLRWAEQPAVRVAHEPIAESTDGVVDDSKLVIPPTPVPAPAPAPPPEPANVAIWVQPLGTVIYGAGSALVRSPQSSTTPLLIYVPLGASVIVPHFELGLELTLTLQAPVGPVSFGTPASTRLGLWAAAGPLVHLGEQPLNGFFLQPKLLGNYAFNLGEQSFSQNLDRWLVALGIDVGYQFTFRHLYCAAVLGLALGAGNYEAWDVPTPWLIGFASSAQSTNPVILFNMNLLRIGGWR